MEESLAQAFQARRKGKEITPRHKNSHIWLTDTGPERSCGHEHVNWAELVTADLWPVLYEKWLSFW